MSNASEQPTAAPALEKKVVSLDESFVAKELAFLDQTSDPDLQLLESKSTDYDQKFLSGTLTAGSFLKLRQIILSKQPGKNIELENVHQYAIDLLLKKFQDDEEQDLQPLIEKMCQAYRSTYYKDLPAKEVYEFLLNHLFARYLTAKMNEDYIDSYMHFKGTDAEKKYSTRKINFHQYIMLYQAILEHRLRNTTVFPSTESRKKILAETLAGQEPLPGEDEVAAAARIETSYQLLQANKQRLRKVQKLRQNGAAKAETAKNEGKTIIIPSIENEQSLLFIEMDESNSSATWYWWGAFGSVVALVFLAVVAPLNYYQVTSFLSPDMTLIFGVLFTMTLVASIVMYKGSALTPFEQELLEQAHKDAAEEAAKEKATQKPTATAGVANVAEVKAKLDEKQPQSSMQPGNKPQPLASLDTNNPPPGQAAVAKNLK